MKVEISDVKLPSELLKPNMPISGVVNIQNDGNKEQKIEIVKVWTQENWKVAVPRKTYEEVVACTPRNPYYDTQELWQMRVQTAFDNQPSEQGQFGDASDAICFQASGKKDIINLAPGSVIKYTFTVKMPSTWNPNPHPGSGWNIHLQGFVSDGKKNHFYSE